MICKNCNKETHCCSSGDSIDYLDNGYCSDSCYKQSKEYLYNYELINQFYKFLPAKHKKEFIYILENLDYSFICDFFKDKGVKFDY